MTIESVRERMPLYLEPRLAGLSTAAFHRTFLAILTLLSSPSFRHQLLPSHTLCNPRSILSSLHRGRLVARRPAAETTLPLLTGSSPACNPILTDSPSSSLT